MFLRLARVPRRMGRRHSTSRPQTAPIAGRVLGWAASSRPQHRLKDVVATARYPTMLMSSRGSVGRKE